MANEASIEKHKFKKGQSGNPGGRPPGQKGFKGLLKDILDEQLPESIREQAKEKLGIKGDLTQRDALLRSAVLKAFSRGDINAIIQLAKLSGEYEESVNMNVNPKEAVDSYVKKLMQRK